MKLRMLLVVVFVLVGATLQSVPCQAQSEIDPDHFETPNVEPFPQPMHVDSSTRDAADFHGSFTLRFSLECAGMILRPGHYVVSIRSLGGRDVVTLMLDGNAARVQTVATSRSSADGPSALILERRGSQRTLTAISLEKPRVTLHLRSVRKRENSLGTELIPISYATH
jgi:hypothetical protein